MLGSLGDLVHCCHLPQGCLYDHLYEQRYRPYSPRPLLLLWVVDHLGQSIVVSTIFERTVICLPLDFPR